MDQDELEKILRQMLKMTSNFGTHAFRNVDHYERDGVMVDTSRVFDGGLPFETGVAHPQYNGGLVMILEAYRTRDEARIGHRRWVSVMTGLEPPERLEDCYNAASARLLKAMGEKLIYNRKDRA